MADCFKYRNKVGIGVAIEELKECWRFLRCTMNLFTIHGYAE